MVALAHSDNAVLELLETLHPSTTGIITTGIRINGVPAVLGVSFPTDRGPIEGFGPKSGEVVFQYAKDSGPDSVVRAGSIYRDDSGRFGFQRNGFVEYVGKSIIGAAVAMLSGATGLDVERADGF